MKRTNVIEITEDGFLTEERTDRKFQEDILWRDGYHCAARLLKEINTEAEFDYIVNFASQTEDFSFTKANQLLFLWTAYCIHCHINAGTGTEYNAKLQEIWGSMKAGAHGPWGDTFTKFSRFMTRCLA